jgi:hypothetical protein
MLFNLNQPYVTWKNPSTNSAVPTWSRPLINGPGTNNTIGDGTSFRARPIKHWRKQLNPVSGSGSGQSGIGMPNDTPGGAVHLGNAQSLICNTNNGIKESIDKVVTCCYTKRLNPSTPTDYHADTNSYLHSRCQTFDQKSSTLPDPNAIYLVDSGKKDSNNNPIYVPAQPSDSSTGSQVRLTQSCAQAKCANNRVTTIYKPNNAQYAQQGAVSSSSRMVRLKLNTINKNGNSFRSAWGQAAANAGKYHGTSDAPYFLKSKNQVCMPLHRDGNLTTNCIHT